MSEDLNVFGVLEAAVEVWREIEDPHIQEGVAAVLGKIVLPDVDSETQRVLADLLIKGALASW